MNIDTGEIRPWASLSEEERKSGRWIALPETDESGQPIQARYDREAAMREFFKDVPQAQYGEERIGSNGRTYRVNALGQYERVRDGK